MFPFQDLCGRPLAAADYIALAGHFHTLCVEVRLEAQVTTGPTGQAVMTSTRCRASSALTGTASAVVWSPEPPVAGPHATP